METIPRGNKHDLYGVDNIQTKSTKQRSWARKLQLACWFAQMVWKQFKDNSVPFHFVSFRLRVNAALINCYHCLSIQV